MKNKIKVIVHHYWSHRCVYGNVNWFTKITSVKTGKSFAFGTPHSSNSDSFLSRLNIEWNERYTIEEGFPIREFNRKKKFIVTDHNSCKDQKIMDKIAKLLGMKPALMN